MQKAYEALAEEIKRLGVTAVFGLMSDDTALLVSTLDAMGIRFYRARHENMGIAMAEGYAAATGKLAIAITGRGPATANSLNGAMLAQRSGSPVLLIYGAAANVGPADLKDFDSKRVMEGAGFRVLTADTSEKLVATFREAAHATITRGCTVLLLPMNVMLGDVAKASDAPQQTPSQRAPAPADKIQQAAVLIRGSKRPLIVAGYGAHVAGARDALIRLADRCGAVLATTLKAKDMFRDHPYNGGILGSFSHKAGRRLFEQADCVIAFGASLNLRTTAYRTAFAQVPIIQIDQNDSHIGRWIPADLGICADAELAAEQLLAALPADLASERPFRAPGVKEELANFDPKSEFDGAHGQTTLDPRLLAIELDRLFPRERNTVYDAGNFIQIEPLVSVPGPGSLKNSWDFSSIGMGIGTALGFAVGAPDKPTILFVGDGGLLMTLGELETLVREDLPVVVVVMNDCAYGAELHYLKERGASGAMASFPDIDFAPIAESLGFEAHTIRTESDLERVAPLLQKPQGPILIDCKIKATVPAPFVLENAARERSQKLSAAPSPSPVR